MNSYKSKGKGKTPKGEGKKPVKDELKKSKAEPDEINFERGISVLIESAIMTAYKKEWEECPKPIIEVVLEQLKNKGYELEIPAVDKETDCIYMIAQLLYAVASISEDENYCNELLSEKLTEFKDQLYKETPLPDDWELSLRFAKMIDEVSDEAITAMSFEELEELAKRAFFD